MNKRQLLELLYSQELKELAAQLNIKRVTPTTSKKSDIELLQSSLSSEEIAEILPTVFRKRAARQRAQAIQPSYLLSLLYNYELEEMASLTNIKNLPSLTGKNREAYIKTLAATIPTPKLKKEVERLLRARSHTSSTPTKAVILVQESLYSVIENAPADLGAYELEKIILDELPKTIREKGQKLELDSNLTRRENQEKPFTVEYGGFSYQPSFKYGSEIVIHLKFFTVSEKSSLLLNLIGLGKIYRKDFRNVLLFVYPSGTLKLGAEEIDNLNSDNIYIIN